jgi:membrane associated rhomboid family serine protease
MFLHGGVLHIAGNMLYLWIFGNNIEDALGHPKFVLFYLLSGLVAAFVQVSFDPAASVPMIGASGAVSGILGAYLLLFPWARVKTLIFIFVFITTVDIPAMVLLTMWFLVQILFSHGQGVAWFAHIGGFVFGLVTVKVFAIGSRPGPKRLR